MPKTLLMVFGLVLSGTASYASDLPPIKPAAPIDLPRFMGKWYVIASIPTRFQKSAYSAVETYELRSDGNVDTMFRFRGGAYSTGTTRPARHRHPSRSSDLLVSGDR